MFGTCGLEMRILIRKMESWEHQWDCPRISHIGVCLKNAHVLFRYFVKLEESIFSALVESGRLFFAVEVVDTN